MSLQRWWGWQKMVKVYNVNGVETSWKQSTICQCWQLLKSCPELHIAECPAYPLHTLPC